MREEVVVLLSPQHPICRRASMDSKKIKIFKNLNIRDIQMSSTEILRVRNYVHITVILFFHLELMSKSVSLKILGLKLVKLDYIIM